MYYKIVYKNIVVDIVENPRWVIWARRCRRFLLTDITTANGIVSSDGSEVFHIDGKKIFINYPLRYKTVSVIEIGENEYLSIKSQITDKTLDNNGNTIEISTIIEKKIAEMSKACEEKIVSGFDIVLSDNILHHFSLNLPDQLKITKLNDRATSGEGFLPYHADNEPCKIYTPQDIIIINKTMEHIIEYQTTYFNSLKMYINGMTDVNEIVNVQYGMTIPEDYQSDVLKMLLNNQNGGE